MRGSVWGCSDNEQFGDPPDQPTSPLTDTKEIEGVLLANLKSSFKYRIDHNVVETHPLEDSGLFFRTFLLSEARLWLSWGEHSAGDDTVLLHVIDKIVSAGKVVIWKLTQHKGMNIYNMAFYAVVGQGRRSLAGSDLGWKYINLRFYSDTPLKRNEQNDHALFDIATRVEAIRDATRARLDARHGDSGLAVESQLHRQQIEEDLDFKRRVARLINPETPSK